MSSIRSQREKANRVLRARREGVRDAISRGDRAPIPGMAVPFDHEIVLVGEAVALGRSDKRPGKKSGAYRLKDEQLFDIAYRVLVRAQSAESAMDGFEREMRAAKVSRTVMLAWLQSVKSSYASVRHQRVETLLADADSKQYAQNPGALLDDVIRFSGPPLVKGIKNVRTEGLTPYELTNFIRSVNDTIDRLTKMTHRNAVTEKIRKQIEALSNDAKTGKRSAVQIGKILEGMAKGLSPQEAIAATEGER